MIKTITADNAQEFDELVNGFDRTARANGILRLPATQTHVLRNEGMRPLFVAVLYYNEVQNGK